MIVPTTDEMDSITADERMNLVGYCESCVRWTHFMISIEEGRCECGSKFSHQIGKQITTQRTWNPKRK